MGSGQWEIRFMLEEHRNHYDHYRPHSDLAHMTPVEFVTKWRAENGALASQVVDR
jgi:L-ascorbate metabolism protein UlaG (beta-lactamase superfamily)